MPRLALIPLAAGLLATSPLLAQKAIPREPAKTETQTTQTTQQSGKSKPASAAEAPPASEQEKRPGFFGRLFSRSPKPTPEPTPAPKPGAKKSAQEKDDSSEKPAKTEGRTEKPEKPRTEKSDTKPDARPNAELKTDSKATEPKRKEAAKPAKASAPLAEGDSEAVERRKYNDAKAKAMEVAEIQRLKERADNAITDEESRKAMRAYNRALADEMRQIDPSIKERIDQIEKLILKRLEE